MESQTPEPNDLWKPQGLTYIKKSKKLEDAKSSSWLFILFGFIGLALLLCVWLNLIPIPFAFYMQVLYTIVLGILFFIFIIVGFFYLHKTKTLTEESRAETQKTEEIISYLTGHYSLEDIDAMINAGSLSMEQRYFERYGKISELIQEQYPILEESYLDYLIEMIYQVYVPEESDPQ